MERTRTALALFRGTSLPLRLSMACALLLGACSGDGDEVPPGDDGSNNLTPGFNGSSGGNVALGITFAVGPATNAADLDAAPTIAGLMPEGLDADTGLVHVGLLPLTNGLTPYIDVTLPDDIYSLTVLAYGHPGTEVLLASVEGPDGVMLVRDTGGSANGASSFPAQFDSPNRVISSTKQGAFLLPNSPDVPFVAGTYRIYAGAFVVRQSTFSVDVDPDTRPLYIALLARKAALRPTLGWLDLTLHFTGSDGLTAATAASDSTFQSALDAMRDTYAAVGIQIDDVEYVDIDDPSLRTIVLSSDTCAGGDLDDLFALSADVAYNNLNIFFVERFQCTTIFGDIGQAIGGISGGIPGVPLAKGTEHSGVAASTAAFLADADTFAVVMAHESAHYLGLYHTQEQNLFGGPNVYDNISDTPNNQNASQNLMYFTAGGSTTLTAGQGYVLHNNPLIRRN